MRVRATLRLERCSRSDMRRLRRSTHPRLLVAVAIPLVLALCLLIAPIAPGKPQAPRAHSSSSYIPANGDEPAQMFSEPLFQQLHTKVVRYIAPYDAVIHSYSLDQAIVFIRAAEAQHEQVLVVFLHPV